MKVSFIHIPWLRPRANRFIFSLQIMRSTANEAVWKNNDERLERDTMYKTTNDGVLKKKKHMKK